MKKNTRIEGLPRIFEAHKRRAAYLFLALSMALVLPPARAQVDVRSSKDVVDTICAECHATGVDGAPKIGDTEAWSSRASQGLSNLTLHALEGIRKMPAHGGHPELSDLDIARAVTYMVNRSGGNWVEPAGVEELAGARSGEQVVKTQCVKCHGEGVGGAPKIGDLEAWVQRMIQGLPYLVRSAIRGHGGMPPRGGQANLTDNELRSAILYMYNPTSATAKPASGVAKPVPGAVTGPNHKFVGGLEIYLGFIAAEKLRALPKDSPERTMHGGIPKGSGYYHVNVTLFDEKSRTPINDAQIQMQLNWPGMTSTAITLEPMQIGAGSYGNYVKPQSGASYHITLRIERPGATPTVEAKFEHKFE
ncbi:MAG: cytochrome c5 family protein [Halobacteria archaeon]|nr:cytochrome c5 family protein [Halobacteria archaeon]